MKIKILIDKEHEEEVIIYAREKTKLVEAITQLVTENAVDWIGYRDKETARLTPADVHCFIVEDNKIYALTQHEKWQLKCRLYQLEEELPRDFLKLNQSCLANLRQIERFNASFSGSLQVVFKNGHIDYVSRRQVKHLKERLGLS